jgi:hypothetical protein
MRSKLLAFFVSQDIAENENLLFLRFFPMRYEGFLCFNQTDVNNKPSELMSRSCPRKKRFFKNAISNFYSWRTRGFAICGLATYVALAALTVMLLGGCSWTDVHGTHHLIVGLGFGVLTTKNSGGVGALNGQVLGATAWSDGVAVGWIQHHSVIIDPVLASNAVVSINAASFGITITNFQPIVHPETIRKADY